MIGFEVYRPFLLVDFLNGVIEHFLGIVFCVRKPPTELGTLFNKDIEK